MDISVVKQIQSSYNLSQIFHTSGLYVNNNRNNEINIELVSFDAMTKDKERRNNIWSNYRNIIEQMVQKQPIIRALLLDLMIFERAVWDATFNEYDLGSYRNKRLCHKNIVM